MNRKQKEKSFKRLRKTDNPFIRLDDWGNPVNWNEFDKNTPQGWKIYGKKGKTAVHWRFCPEEE